MKKALSIICIWLTFSTTCIAQGEEPELEFVMELRVNLGQAFNIGQTPSGERQVIPILGGSFEGPRIKGEILEGGADYQLRHLGRTDLEAIYCIRTDDNVSIHVRNTGIIAGNYFYCTPKFEAPEGSKYAWLNNAIYICKPSEFLNNGIKLKVWKIRDAYSFENTIQSIPLLPDSARQIATHQGTIETFQYTAHKDGKAIRKHARVYLPYGYRTKDKKAKYDVLYLMHGGGDNSTSFLAPPQDWLPLKQVLDLLIERREMRPIIVVTPTFYDDDENIGANSMSDATERTRDFHKELQDDLIPAVENAYHTYLAGKDSTAVTASRSHRAYGGFSMGALSTWYQLAYGVNAARYFIPLSGDLWIFNEKGEKQDAKAAAEWLNTQVEKSPFAKDFEVYAYTGTEDIAGNPEKSLIEALDKYAPLFRYNQTDANLRFSMREGGRHFYGHINEYLYFALPLIFPSK